MKQVNGNDKTIFVKDKDLCKSNEKSYKANIKVPKI